MTSDYEYEIEFDGNFVRVHARGTESIENASRLWPDVLATCKQNDCFKVLGVAETTTPLGILDSMGHADLFRRLGIDSKYRIAWVELNPLAHEAISFTEIVLSNRGLPGKLFNDPEVAEDWLSAQ
jgi:hypothetical protein